MDFSFTDISLNTPSVDTRVYYPAISAGTNVPLANGQFPTIAFGHGFNLNYLDYTILCGHLASWGYIVISPDVQNGFSVDHLEFAKELTASILAIQSENQTGSSPFFQKVDTMTGVCGHSMGGGASALVPGIFPNIDAVSGMAAAETTPSAISALASYNGPFQSISGSSDNTAPEATNQSLMYSAATGSKQWLSITGGAHCKFTDGLTVCDLVSSAGSVSREDQIFSTGKYLTAFFNFYLKGDNDALPFLCGDSVGLDVSNTLVSNTTTIDCNLVANEVSSPSVQWTASPNPSDKQLRIFGTNEVQVFAADGRSMGRFCSEQAEWNLSVQNWPNGLYWLKGNRGQTQKVLIQH